MEAEFLTLMRAELEKAMAVLELRLVDRFAGKKDFEELDKRVGVLEQGAAGHNALSSWQRWLFGGLGFGAFASAVYVALLHVH